MEFSGELSDFITRDVHQRYAHVKNYIHVTLIEVSVQNSSSLALLDLTFGLSDCL